MLSNYLKNLSKRQKFFIGHVTLSLLIASVIIFLVYVVWYPAPLAYALGVSNLFLMMMMIDIIIGPILGFLVYKEGKKTLKMDLTIIVILQLSALLYGVYSITQSRPAWLVYHGAVFSVVKNIDVHYTPNAKPEYQQTSWTGPKYVAYTLPQSHNITNLANPSIQSAIGDINNPMMYGNLDSVRMFGLPLSTLERFNDKALIDKTLQKYPTADAWVGMMTGGQDMVVLINKQENKIVKIVDLRPWK